MKALVETDLEGADWVVTAYCCQDPAMLQVVEEGLKPHVRTGSLISGAPEDFVEMEHKLVGDRTDPVEIAHARKGLPDNWHGIGVHKFFLPRSMSIRQAGKKSNHGLNYDMRYKRFALENEMAEADAKRIVDNYKNIAYPGLKRWYKLIEAELRANRRRLTNCFGQTRAFMDRWGPDLLDAAYAFKPQSTVANVTNRGLRTMYWSAYDRVHVAAQVHDYILTHHNFGSWDELADQVVAVDNAMTCTLEYHEREFVLKRSIKLGVNWGKDCMIEVEKVRDLPVALRAAWEQSCAQEAR